MVQYVNAGHSPPVILGPEGIKTVLIPTGPAIGAAGDSGFARETTELTSGDCLLLHSDGVIEAQNENGAVFSEQRLHELLADGTHLASALVARVEGGVRQFMGDTANTDDITVLAIRRERRD
jgi:serine phosphatase RsbU (regulator of sigma subunit)